MSEFEFHLKVDPPKYVGGYYLGGLNGFGVMLCTKPHGFHRFMMHVCLGWQWIDGPIGGGS